MAKETTNKVKSVEELQHPVEDPLDNNIVDEEEELAAPPEPVVEKAAKKAKSKPLDPDDAELDKLGTGFKLTAADKEMFEQEEAAAIKALGPNRRLTISQMSRNIKDKVHAFTKREMLQRYKMLKARLTSEASYKTVEQVRQARYEIALMEKGEWNPTRNQFGGLDFPKAPPMKNSGRAIADSIRELTR